MRYASDGLCDVYPNKEISIPLLLHFAIWNNGVYIGAIDSSSGRRLSGREQRRVLARLQNCSLLCRGARADAVSQAKIDFLSV